MREKESSLTVINPKLALEWHPNKNGESLPSTVTAGTNKKAWWICDKGHVWEAIISSRNKGAGCMLCYRESN